MFLSHPDGSRSCRRRPIHEWPWPARWRHPTPGSCPARYGRCNGLPGDSGTDSARWRRARPAPRSGRRGRRSGRRTVGERADPVEHVALLALDQGDHVAQRIDQGHDVAHHRQGAGHRLDALERDATATDRLQLGVELGRATAHVLGVDGVERGDRDLGLTGLGGLGHASTSGLSRFWAGLLNKVSGFVTSMERAIDVSGAAAFHGRPRAPEKPQT